MAHIELENAVRSGVELKVLGADMVPLYEEHEARLERGFSLAEWGAMDVIERALLVALRRVRIAIENLQAEAQIQHAKRNARSRR